MPNGNEFEKKLLEWESKAKLYEAEVKPLEERATVLGEQLAQLGTLAKTKAQDIPAVREMYEVISKMPGYSPATGILSVQATASAEYKSVQQSLLKNVFYIDLYGVAPSLVLSGKANSVDEVLSMMAIPEDLSSTELADAREVISSMLGAKTAGEPLELGEEAEVGELEYPELVAPVPPTGVPVSIHSLSTQEIIKSLKTPVAPESAMTEVEWEEYLAELGWSQDEIDNETQIRADQLVEDALNRKSQIEEFRSQVAEMPEYKVTDFLKEIIIQPPLAVLEALNFYYEHVSMPAAGFVFSWIPDINRAYFDFKAANPEATNRELYTYAWQQWEAPGPPVLDFIYKYIIMEGLVDPMTYVGWGIATKLTKPLGGFGRMVKFSERAAAEIFEMPFDFLKWGVRTAIPKTAAQRALVASRNLGKTIDRYFTKTIGRPLSFIQMDEMSDAAALAIKHFVDSPRSEDDVARAGLAMCAHSPVGDTIARNWIQRLRAAGLTTFSPDDITAQTLKDIDDIFERVFFKEITAEEIAPMLLLKLGVTAPSDDAAKLATRLLSQRYDRVITNASRFTLDRSPLRAMRTYMRVTEKAMVTAERSKAALVARQSGRMATLLFDIPQQLQRTWTNQIDKWVVRPAAQAYLTFGMYGPMNVAEDIWRSCLGGVRPGRASIEALDIETLGLRIDPELRTWGLSEMMGPLKQTAGQPTRNNWILTIGMAPLSLPTYAATRGRVTPAKFARNTYATLVEMFGGIGMDMRRNFIVGRNRQLLAEAGGDAYQALAKAGPKEIPTGITQKFLRKEVKNQVHRAKVTGALTPDNQDFINALKARFSRERVVRGEVTNIVSRYPDVSNSSRNLVTQLYDEGTLFRSAPRLQQRFSSIRAPKQMGEWVVPKDKLAQLYISSAEGKTNRALLNELSDDIARKLEWGRSQVDTIMSRYPKKNVEELVAEGLIPDYLLPALNLTEVGSLPYLHTLKNPLASTADKMVAFDSTIGEIHPMGVGTGRVADWMIEGGGQTLDILASADINVVRDMARYVVPDSIDRTMRNVVWANEVDDFLKGPEVAAVQYQQLTDMLRTLEVRSPEDMAHLIQSVTQMSKTYGAMPRQIMGRATVKSRGLPLAERRTAFDIDFDRIHTFMDKAGVNIDDVVDKVRLTMREPTKIGSVDWGTIRFGEGITSEVQDTIRKAVDDLPFEFKAKLQQITLDPEIEHGAQIWAGRNLTFKNLDYAQSPSVVIHELGHSVFSEAMTSRPGLNEAYARLVIRPTTKARTAKEISEEAVELVESFADDFLTFSTDPRLLKADSPKRFTLFEEFFPKTQRALPLTEGYMGAADDVLDIMTASREYATEFRTQNMATRHEIFSEASKADMKSTTFWDDFYLQMDNETTVFNKRMAELNGKLTQSLQRLNEAAGAKMPVRPKVVVRNRPLAPADVAKLMQNRNDEVSRMLLDVLTAEGDRDFFVEYVMGLAREGYDVGFTREAVGEVYDQIAYSMRVDPNSSSWLRSREMELDSMTRDLHDLYNSKLLPDEQVTAIGKYIDDTADAAGKVMYEPAKAITPEAAPMSVKTLISLDELEEGMSKEFAEALEIWTKQGTTKSLNDVARLARADPRYRAKMLSVMKEQYGDSIIVYRAGAAERPIVSVTTSKEFAESRAARAEAFRIGTDDIIVANPTMEHELLVRATKLKPIVAAPPIAPPVRVKKPEFANYDDLRQSAWDEAEKWYYKEYPDYTNANAFDSMMKTIYPFWTYESQRWFWLPRSFARHPGTLTALGRYQRETEYGYFHIPGTAIDWRPVSGTIYGPWTSLMRRDYPEYYDQLEGAQGLVEFSDFLQRYGFYPNVIASGVQAAFGGREQQMGGVLPTMYTTPLNSLIAAFPDNEAVNFISERIFPNRFRTYLIGRRISDLGGKGAELVAKTDGGKDLSKLTPEEEDLWTTARQSVALHSAAFEQFGMFRMRSDESYEIYEAAAKFIEGEFGYTPEQQKQLRLHGYSLWDMVGGLDPWQTAAMQELEYFKYVGSVTPLLPSAQQEIVNRNTTDWADVQRHSETMQLEILDLQQDFLVGTEERGKLGPSQFLSRVKDLFGKRKDYVDEKVKANPLMLLENRTEYYEKYRQPIPVLSPYDELMAMYFNIELEETVDEATGERIYDWDKFWANRAMIEAAISDEDKAKWDDYISRNTAPIMRVWYEVYDRYFKKYYGLWEATLETYPDEEQKLLEEFFYLERMGTDLARQASIKEMVSAKTDDKLVSSFRSDVSDNRASLRYANPALDAWLFYWGKVSSFKTPQAETIYKQISKDTGRAVQ